MSFRGRVWAGAGALGLAAACGALAASPAELSAAADGTEAGGGVVATGLPQGGAVWSQERMRRAEGAGITLDGRPGSPDAGAARFRSKRLRNTTAYPNRVHGRVFGSFGGSDFSCSGTVVTSGRGTLITTAGHCAYDDLFGRFVDELTFVPGYRNGKAPFGAFEATHIAVPGQWARLGHPDFDVAFVQLAARGGRSVQETVGSRGIGFKQPNRQRIASYGYPAAPRRYDGEDLVRCKARSSRERRRHSRNGSLRMGCDMLQGASGGGWVAQDSFIVSNTSHGHSRRNVFFGPRYRGAAKSLYRFSDPGDYPSVRPVRCDGRVATIVGTERPERIRGTRKDDVIATLGGRDRVNSRGGKDTICLGAGNDRARSGGSRDRIFGGAGSDFCDGGAARDRARDCERTRRIP